MRETPSGTVFTEFHDGSVRAAYTERMAKVESFNLDHTRVRAPYVRVAGRYTTPHGDPITKFDLRFAQPNKAFLPTGALHTLEHLLAGNLRDFLPGIVDLSPMGCRTGFYLTVSGDPEPQAVIGALEKTLERVRDFEGPIPGSTEIECGNYRDHSLTGAKDWALKVLEGGLTVQETVLIPAEASTQ
jgi:S-ribosylhomocysteine lyase